MRQLRCHWFLLLQPYSELLQFARETDLAGLDDEHHSHVPWVSLCSECMVYLTAISILRLYSRVRVLAGNYCNPVGESIP